MAAFNHLHCHQFRSLKGRGNEVTVATIQKRELKEQRNGSNPISMARGGRLVARTSDGGFGLKEGEMGRGAAGPAWAERLSGADRFQGKGARATRRMRAKM
jgi:hypothetical protein